MKKILFTAIFIGLVSTQLVAQNRVTGRIVDERNEPLAGAYVVVVGKMTGTTADAQGRYAINAERNETLRFSFIGYEEKEVKVGSGSVVDVALFPSSTVLEEVVAIGYGYVAKSDLSGAVGSLKGSTLVQSAPVSLSQGLQGRLAGVLVQQMDGAPGSGVSIEIRGANSFTGGTQPLYVIDDIPYDFPSVPGAAQNDYSSASPLGLLVNPNDILAIEILKDASATAIYGSRGANGVVLIRTKQGQVGRAKIDVNVNQGWSIINRTINVLDAQTYAKLYVEGRLNSSLYDVDTEYLAQNNMRYADVFGTKPDLTDVEYYKTHFTNWQDEIFQIGRLTDGTFSISGGTNAIKYMVSASAVDQTGILISSGYQRAGLRMNLSGNVSPRVKFRFTSNFAWDNNRFVRTGSDVGQQGGVIKSALRYPPIYHVRTSEGELADEWGDASNPLTYVTSQKNEVESVKNTVNGQLEAQIFKTLTFQTRLAADYGTSTRSQYLPIGVRESKTGMAYNRQNRSTKMVNENILTYNETFNKVHKLTLMGAFTCEVGRGTWRQNEMDDFVNDILQDNRMQAGQGIAKISNGRSMTTLASFLGRVNYTMREKYILTASIRADGSSKFAVNNKWAYFPSGAIAWRIDQEPFLKQLGIFDELKLRLGYGETGNQGISAYQSMTDMSANPYAFDGQLRMGVYVNPSGLGNDFLSWETTKHANAGIDISLVKNRLQFTVDVYHKETVNLLQTKELPLSLGYSSRMLNMGSLQNEGLEFTVNAIPVAKRNFYWNVNFNIFSNKSKVLSLGGEEEQTVSRVASNVEPFRLRVGAPLGEIWALKVLGIYQNMDEVMADGYWDNDPKQAQFMVGEYRYFNPRGTGQEVGPPENMRDAVIVGHTNPKFLFGLNNSFSIYNFDISIFIQGSYGNDIVNTSRWDMLKDIGGSSSNITWEVYNNLWRGEGTGNKYPKSIDSRKRYRDYFSDVYVEDGSYIKLKSVNVGYTFNLKNQNFIRTLKLSAIGTNLYCLTNYTGFDPEVNAFNTDPRRRGVDMGNYPGSMMLSFNLQATF